MWCLVMLRALSLFMSKIEGGAAGGQSDYHSDLAHTKRNGFDV